jgi:hypothetical protein
VTCHCGNVVSLQELLNHMTSEDADGKMLICLYEVTPCHIADDNNCGTTMRMLARTTSLCVLAFHFCFAFLFVAGKHNIAPSINC